MRPFSAAPTPAPVPVRYLPSMQAILPARSFIADPAAAPALAAWRWRGQWFIWVGTGIATLNAILNGAMKGLVLWQGILVIFGLTTLYCQATRLLSDRVRRWLPSYEQTASRIRLHLLLSFGLMVSIALLAAVAETHLVPHARSYWACFWKALSHGLIPSIVIAGMYEGSYFFAEWRRSYTRSADLEKENALSRLEALKQQVDPHFLFNSLNTMAALVGDNEEAQDFLGALANVYRYVLLNKVHSTVPLAQEMAFVDDYLYLHHIRFDNIEVIRDIAPATLALHIPPISVQMLLENALKHNAIGPRHTLRITIRANGDYLSVTNSIHRKTILEKGTRQGLQNIVNRFQLLTDRKVTVENRGREFEVTLPLLPAA